MRALNLLSCDVGGSGGKVQLGRFDGERLTSETVLNYRNATVDLLGEQYWDFLRMVRLRDEGVARAAAETGGDIASLGTTVFGNSFVLLDGRGKPFSTTYAVYPGRLDAALEEVGRRFDLRALHDRTGAEIRNYITACQLTAYRLNGEAALLDYARSIALFQDALNYTLSGVLQAEITSASTGGLYNPRLGDWDDDILRALEIPRSKLPPLVPPLTVQGEVRAEACRRLGLRPGAKVVNAPGHDTAAAVYALPCRGDALFLSLGTMALIGYETDHLIINGQTFAHRLSNCASPDGRNFLMSAIRCMWHMEKCRLCLPAGDGELTYDRICALAAEAAPMERIIDLDDGDYLAHAHDLPRVIAEYCARTGQKPITSPGELFRCLFDSMAWAIVRELEVICGICGSAPEPVYVLGGGGRNAMLMQLVADCSGRELAVPQYEATSYGVLLSQLAALGELSGRDQAKALVGRSVPLKRYEPRRQVDLDGPRRFWREGRRSLREVGLA